jgi:hypothetical protein
MEWHPMDTMDRETLAEWLDLDLDGQLAGTEKARLAKWLAAEPALAAEKRRLESLHALFRESRIPVRRDFRDRVTASLPAPAWQRSPLPIWALPAAMAAVLAAAAALVLGLGAPLADGPAAGTGLALFDFLKVTALAGAGLAAASWQGLGLVLEELIVSSGLNLLAMAVLVLFLNLLLFSMLRRRPATDVLPILERGAGDVREETEGARGGE